MRKVSDILREKREEKNLSLAQVSNDTKIKKEFLVAIEENRFYSLPSESYALGFVKNYAKYLGISASTIVPLFRREYKSSKIQVVPRFWKSQAKFNRKFFLNSKSFLFLLSLLLIFIYIFFQYNSIIFPPGLSVSKPKNNQEIQGNAVEIVGKTDPYATIYIDGDEAYVDLSGNFRKSIFVFSGDKKIEIVAKNRFGRETRREINIKVK
jgi:cytoskeletal protein RodZ